MVRRPAAAPPQRRRFLKLTDKESLIDTGDSLRRMVTYRALAFLVAVPVGLAMGAADMSRRSSTAADGDLSGVSVMALMPIIMLWLGVGDASGHAGSSSA